MTYDPAIPQAKTKVSTSQANLLTNFGQLNTIFAVNHVAFNDASGDKGKHKFCTFVEQANAPETKADEHVVYAADDSGTPELFARPENNGTVYQLTKGGSVFTGLLPVAAVNFTSAPAIQGTALNVSGVTVSSGVYTVTFASALPEANYFWSVSGFDATSTAVIGQVASAANYGDSVTTAKIDVFFYKPNGTASTIVRGCVMCWRYQ